MALASTLFEEIKQLLLSVPHPEWSAEETSRNNMAIINIIKVHQDICMMLDLIRSKMRMKRGTTQPSDREQLQRALANLDLLWATAGISYTPKIHSMLSHAFDQWQRLGGFGDLLEDDLEHLHQISKSISDRTSRIKCKEKQAFVHSKLEHKLNNHEIKTAIAKTRHDTKRTFKKRPIDAISKRGVAKQERDISRMNSLVEIEQNEYETILSLHEQEKRRMLSCDAP